MYTHLWVDFGWCPYGCGLHYLEPVQHSGKDKGAFWVGVEYDGARCSRLKVSGSGPA